MPRSLDKTTRNVDLCRYELNKAIEHLKKIMPKFHRLRKCTSVLRSVSWHLPYLEPQFVESNFGTAVPVIAYAAPFPPMPGPTVTVKVAAGPEWATSTPIPAPPNPPLTPPPMDW